MLSDNNVTNRVPGYRRLQEESKPINGDHQSIIMVERQDKLDSMKKIEEMLNQVASVFQRIAATVKMHEIMLDRIDSSTSDSLSNVQKGRKELTKAHERISQNRGLIIKVFLILFLFAFIYIVFVL